MSDIASLSILNVQASGRRTHSVSRSLSDEVIAALGTGGADLKVIQRDLLDGIPFVDENWIGANFTPIEQRTAEQSATLAFSDQLIEEVEAADVLIIGSPIYNFGVPAALKAWVDQIARARKTFAYTESGPVGLLEGKRAILVVTSGGTEVGSDIDFATGYLRHVLGFVGIHDVELVTADRQMADAEAARARASDQIAALLPLTTR
ncbi:MAG: NAD(P)H-dependent oxidoreductase [Pseudomonadota bacterium]